MPCSPNAFSASGVDIDHVIKAPFYLRTGRQAAAAGLLLRTSLQEPVALLWMSVVFSSARGCRRSSPHPPGDGYSVGYEKMPWIIPPLVTQGFLVGVSDTKPKSAADRGAAMYEFLLFLAPL